MYSEPCIFKVNDPMSFDTCETIKMMNKSIISKSFLGAPLSVLPYSPAVSRPLSCLLL